MIPFMIRLFACASSLKNCHQGALSDVRVDYENGTFSPGAREVLFVFYLPKGLIVGSIVENSADFRNAILTKIRSARFELLAF